MADQQKREKMDLVLADGSVYSGFSFGASKSVAGEVCFQTGMVGYVESLTDPSYRGQILVLSYPLIGNYGVPPSTKDANGIPEFFESEEIHVAGLIVADYSDNYSHWNAAQSLGDWLKSKGIPALFGVDTRALIKKIRNQGAQLGKVVHEKDNADKIPYYDPNTENLVAQVSSKEPKVYGEGSIRVLLVDMGFKMNQLRCFLARGIQVKVVPWDYDIVSEKEPYHGLFISNGPGDPTIPKQTISNVAKIVERESKKDKPIPIFGICLGNQILGLAIGAKTFKLKFGNRGQNQPCVAAMDIAGNKIDNGRCHLTMQNHGFAIDPDTLPTAWNQFFYNLNDNTNEGIRHSSLPFFSVQFHPEAKGGPKETEYLFDMFDAMMQGKAFEHKLAKTVEQQENIPVSKVLILGSGGLSIGQAGEFDYSGSQAIKALKEQGIKTVLINSNIATVQTTPGMADKIYFLPVTPEFVKKVVNIEKPDGILLTFGGQTALNCGIDLYKEGFFKASGCRVMGTPIEVILATEDREIFSTKLKEIGESIAPSIASRTVDGAVEAAIKIGFPVIVRAGFALGGLGSGFANNAEELRKLVTLALASSEQVLVERSLKGWKEVEYEVVRDSQDNCITVCNMENFDPLGIHTGESIVVAPSQTLSDRDYHSLRRVSINVVRHLGVVGECNIQFALDPLSNQYYIIEVNARLSRSSALASKATGYPLAFVAAKLSLGIPLTKLKNSVTKLTSACFEPSLDYVVVKVPRWDIKKFSKVSRQVGTSMKSVGEIMAIGRTFEEAIQKACRMVDNSSLGFNSGTIEATDEELENPSYERIFVIAEALAKGYSVEKLYKLTNIDRWFLYRLENIIKMETFMKTLNKSSLKSDMLLKAKKLGFSDKHIAKCVASSEVVIREMRTQLSMFPVVKQIDTVAAEFPCMNNYLYLTYNGTEDDVEQDDGGVIVLGSGAYCIGSSVEFDWCAVSCIRTLEKLGHRTIMINYNPETVSTDYDECNKLYFEEISLEVISEVYRRENPVGVAVSMGGQLANNIALNLSRAKINVLGTSPENINGAENRYTFSRMLDTLGVAQPKWKECKNMDEMMLFCKSVGYPVLVRPSFVLSGAGMTVVYSDKELKSFLTEETLAAVSKDCPVVISKFISGAKEIDVDAVASNGKVIVHAISEHIENAGVHSGDATLVQPAQDLDPVTIVKLKTATDQIARALEVSGPFNIQFIAKNNEILVIECNCRTSRSFPFVSKTLGVNFAELATKVILGHDLEPIEIDLSRVHHVGVKVPQFSFSRLQGADPILGVEMASTGEVACFGSDKYSAYLKALISTGFVRPKKNILLSIGAYAEKKELLPSIQKLKELGFTLFGTPGTADFLSENGIVVSVLDGEVDSDEFSVEHHLSSNLIDMAIILPSKNKFRRPSGFMTRGYQTRRLAVDFSVPLITDIKCAKLLVESLARCPLDMKVTKIDMLTSHNTAMFPSPIALDRNLCTSSATMQSRLQGYVNAGFPTVIVGADKTTNFASIAKNDSVANYGFIVPINQVNDISSEAVVGTWLDVSEGESSMLKWTSLISSCPSHLPIVAKASGTSLATLVLLSSLYKRNLHLIEVSTVDELTVIAAAKEQGISVTCGVTIDDITANEALQAILLDNLAVIDTITIDAAESSTSLDLVVPKLLTLVSKGQMTIEDLTDKIHTAPLHIFGLNNTQLKKSYIEVDCNEPWQSQGTKLTGKIQRVVINGSMASRDGTQSKTLTSGLSLSSTKSRMPLPSFALPSASPINSPTKAKINVSQDRIDVSEQPAIDKKTTPLFNVPSKAIKESTARPEPILFGQLLRDEKRARFGSFFNKDVISVKQFTRKELHYLFAVAQDMRVMVKRMGSLDLLRGKVLANVFYEPSTRTSSSFYAAMARLGGTVIPFNPTTSSVTKGETLEDTIRCLECYCDLIVLRHPEPGSVERAAAVSAKPVINAGDGIGEHPTQALLDVFTIRQELGTVNGLTVTIVGDLKHGRTVHSLVQILALYDVSIRYVAPESLEIPEDIYKTLEKNGTKQAVFKSLEDALPDTDVLYVTRIQKERFSNPEDYLKLKGSYNITAETLTKAKENIIVMHPLPRVDEISTEVDSDARAAYFRQMEHGMFVRMALLAMVLGKS